MARDVHEQPRDTGDRSRGRSAAADLDPDTLARLLEQRTRELEETQTRFRNIIQRTADGIIILSLDGRILFVNPAAEALFGRPAAELIGNEFGAPLTAGDTTELDIVQRPGQEPVVAELRAAETQWGGQQARLVSLRDVTDRKRAEQRAQRLLLEQAARQQAEEAHRRVRFLAEASAVLEKSLVLEATVPELARHIVPRLADWCRIDVLPDGDAPAVHACADERPDALRRHEAADANAWARAALELLGPRDARLLRDLDAHRVRTHVRDGAAAQLLADVATRSLLIVPLPARQRPLGTIALGCSEKNFDTPELALALEIAERVARAAENARLYRAALAASRAKSDFLAIVSHELRTPLNAIMGYTDMLLAGVAGELRPEQAARLRRVEASARHLLQIIQEILAYAELDAGRDRMHPTRFTLGALIEDLVATVTPALDDKALELHVDTRNPDAPLFTDRGKLRQIALNVLSNAVSFTDAGSVHVRAGIEGDDLVLAISDTGIGIAPEHLERIFEPFWQAEQPLTRSTGGTGLGLSVARRFAELLGGSLTATSDVGVGSTFVLRIPTHHPAGTGPGD